MLNYIVRHWRGESSLAAAWWLNGIGITALALVLERRFGGALASAVDSPEGYGAFVLGGVALLLVVPAWQVIGIFRAADRHAAQVGTILGARFVQSLTTLLTIVLAVRFMTFAGEAAGGAKIAWRMGRVGYSIAVTHHGRVLEIKGSFLLGLADEAQRVLAASPHVRRVRLNSGGGSLSEARKLRELILARRLDTDSTIECSSACASAYIAGRHRLLHRAARMGFHLPRNPGFGLRSPVMPEYAQELRYFGMRGVQSEFRQRLIASGRKFWYPPPALLHSSGIVDTFYGVPLPGEEFYYR
jgi:hypothetical protein